MSEQDHFSRVPKLEFEGRKQEDFGVGNIEEIDQPVEEDVASNSATLISEYKKTVKVMKAVESQIRTSFKASIKFDPADEPEVWAAMQRIYDNPNPEITSDTYYELLDFCQQLNELEADDLDPGLGDEFDLPEEFK